MLKCVSKTHYVVKFKGSAALLPRVSFKVKAKNSSQSFFLLGIFGNILDRFRAISIPCDVSFYSCNMQNIVNERIRTFLWTF